MNIEIPEPVIKAEVDFYESPDDDYIVNVEVGGVVVMTRTYARGWRPNGEPYVSDVKEAQTEALSEFGHALRKLIADDRR